MRRHSKQQRKLSRSASKASNASWNNGNGNDIVVDQSGFANQPVKKRQSSKDRRRAIYRARPVGDV